MRQEQSLSIDLASRLPWAGRFHVLRLMLVLMVLALLAVQVGSCGRLTAYSVLLFGFGLVYPFLVRVLLGRLEGRRRHGRVSLLFDGFFAGALLPAIGFEPTASIVIGLVSLFNWIAVGGVAFAINGLVAAAAGLGVSAAIVGLDQARSCEPAAWLAYGVLLVYMPFVAWAMFRYGAALRQRCDELQLERDRAESGRCRVSQLLTGLLPEAAARQLLESGDISRRTLPDAVLLLGAVRSGSDSGKRVAWLGNLLGPCREILARHDLELVKTFGGRFLALAKDSAGVDSAVAAAQEIAAYFRNHGGAGPDGGTEWPLCLTIHCGSVEAGLVRKEVVDYDVVGQPLDEAVALATRWDAPGVLVSSSARLRLQGDWQFKHLGTEGLSAFLLVDRVERRDTLAGPA